MARIGPRSLVADTSLKYQYFAPSGKIFNGMIQIGVFLEKIWKGGIRQWGVIGKSYMEDTIALL